MKRMKLSHSQENSNFIIKQPAKSNQVSLFCQGIEYPKMSQEWNEHCSEVTKFNFLANLAHDFFAWGWIKGKEENNYRVNT